MVKQNTNVNGTIKRNLKSKATKNSAQSRTHQADTYGKAHGQVSHSHSLPRQKRAQLSHSQRRRGDYAKPATVTRPPVTVTKLAEGNDGAKSKKARTRTPKLQPQSAAPIVEPEPLVVIPEFTHPQQAGRLEQRATRWFLKSTAGGLIPAADTTLVAGKKSSAKSPFAYHLIACAGGEKEFAEGVTVEPNAAGGFQMLFTSERDLAECVLPRLEMSGADTARVIVVPFEDPAGDKSKDCDTLQMVAAKYEETLTALQDHYRDAPHLARISLVVVEMLDDYEDMVKMKRRPSEALRPFHRLAKENGTAFVFFVHLLEKGSGSEKSFAAMIQGRSGWVRAVSTIWGMAMKDDKGVVELCYSNLSRKGQRWNYRAEGRVNLNRPELEGTEIPAFVMEDVAQQSVMQVLRALDKGSEQAANPSVRQQFKAWFLKWLSEGKDIPAEVTEEATKRGIATVEGARPSADILAAAEGAGFPSKSKTIQRGREELKAVSTTDDFRVGNKHWVVLRKPMPPVVDETEPADDGDVSAKATARTTVH